MRPGFRMVTADKQNPKWFRNQVVEETMLCIKSERERLEEGDHRRQTLNFLLEQIRPLLGRGNQTDTQYCWRVWANLDTMGREVQHRFLEGWGFEVALASSTARRMVEDLACEEAPPV